MLSSIFEFGIGNTAVAAVMALVVFAVTRVWRNQYLAHGLWLLVLVKLITPQLWQIPVPIGGISAFGDGSVTTADNAYVTSGAIAALDASAFSERRLATQYDSNATDASVGGPQLIGTDPATYTRSPPSWHWMLVLAWTIGFAVWLGIISWRVIRFICVVRATVPATPELLRNAESTARRLGLKRLPAVRLTKAVIAPMVWPVGCRPVVILPQQLVRELDSTQLATVIAHEFTHVRRCDHWVRYLEVAVTLLYWWNPLVWFVQRQLHLAEEACCDAEVMRLFPTDAAAYGDALLRTVEFTLSGRVPAPALASGFVTPHPLKRRVEMILSDQLVAQDRRMVRWAFSALALAIMPLSAKMVLAEDTLRTTKYDVALETNDVADDAVASETSDARSVTSAKAQRSLEERVGRIEVLLEKLLHAQRKTSKTDSKAVYGFSDKMAQPLKSRGSDASPNPASAAPANGEKVELDVQAAVGKDTAVVYMPVVNQDGETIYRIQAVTKTPMGKAGADGRHKNYYYATRSPRDMESSVQDLVDAIKKKQAAIKQLEEEIKQIRQALGPEPSPSPYRLRAPGQTR